MINIDLGGDRRLCMLLGQTTRTIGKNQHRTLIECELYQQPTKKEPLIFIAKGIAILNPLDTFNPTVGAHKALQSALTQTNATPGERKIMHDAIASWTR